jgi:hypothetical protein
LEHGVSPALGEACALEETRKVVRNGELVGQRGQRGKGLEDKGRDFDPVAIARPTAQGREELLEFCPFASVPGELRQPIHHGAKATLVVHQRTERLADQCARKELPGEDALQVQTGILHPGNQVIPQPGSLVLHPGAGQALRFFGQPHGNGGSSRVHEWFLLARAYFWNGGLSG